MGKKIKFFFSANTSYLPVGVQRDLCCTSQRAWLMLEAWLMPKALKPKSREHNFCCKTLVRSHAAFLADRYSFHVENAKVPCTCNHRAQSADSL